MNFGPPRWGYVSWGGAANPGRWPGLTSGHPFRGFGIFRGPLVLVVCRRLFGVGGRCRCRFDSTIVPCGCHADATFRHTGGVWVVSWHGGVMLCRCSGTSVPADNHTKLRSRTKNPIACPSPALRRRNATARCQPRPSAWVSAPKINQNPNGVVRFDRDVR